MEIRGLIKDFPVRLLLEQAESEEQTGNLILKSKTGIGEISFANGLIYSADAPFVRERIGQRLVQNAMIRSSDLYCCLREQVQNQNLLLGEILSRRNLLPPEAVHAVISRQIEDAVLYLLSWDEGQFSFERTPPGHSCSVTIRPKTLLSKKKKIQNLKASSRQGILQWMEDHPGSLLHQRFLRELERKFSRANCFEPRIVVVLVEGESRFRMLVQEELAKQNFTVKGVSGPDKTRDVITRLLETGYSPIVITDVDFTRSGRKVKLEGLSLMESLHQEHPEIPIVVATTYPISNLRRKILFFGGLFCLTKPDLSVLSSRNFEQIFSAYIRELTYCLDLSIHQYYQQYYQEREELIKDDLLEHLYNTREEVALTGNELIEAASAQEVFYQTSELLVRRGNVDKAINTVLDFVIQFCDHAALFLWGQKYLNGYLGRSSLRADFSDRIRKVSVEYGRIPFLKKLYGNQELVNGPLPEDSSYLDFIDQFLEIRPASHMLYPVVVMGKVVALWYVDSVKEKERVPRSKSILSLVNLIALSVKLDIEGV